MIERGFTVIEILFVIILISILGVIALPKFISVNNEASYATARQVLSQFKSGAEHFRYKCISSGLLGQSFSKNDPDNDEYVRKIQAAGLLSRPSGTGNCYPEAQINDGNINDNADCIHTFNAVTEHHFDIKGINRAGSPHDVESEIVAQLANVKRCRYFYLKGFENAPDDEVPFMLYNAGNGTFTLYGFPE